MISSSYCDHFILLSLSGCNRAKDDVINCKMVKINDIFKKKLFTTFVHAMQVQSHAPAWKHERT